jgi:hypothetical protein
MPFQPQTERDLAAAGSRQWDNGWRLLLVGGVLFAIGLVFMIAGRHVADFVGVALAALATPPTLGGLGLVIASLVSRRASQHKPFA